VTLLKRCICGEAVIGVDTWNGIPILRCGCGIARQDVDMTEEQLAAWYETRYYDGVYTHTREHDLDVAARRMRAYGARASGKLLDVGAGNGAFVQIAMEAGLDAWGQDPAVQNESDRTYLGHLADVAFPTADFDTITMHDVLEHVPDPVAFLTEVKRILKPGGRLILDFPRFWDAAGRHHWKRIEHLWMLTGNQLMDLLQRVGFDVERACNPIPSKIVIEVRAPAVLRTRILVPAGIGDAYWVMTKLRGFMREKGIVELPEIVVQDAGGPKRTQPFLRTVPFVHAGGYELLRTRHNIWKEAYLEDGRTSFEHPFPGIDWFIAYNGVMKYGKSLAQVDPQWPVEWRFKQHVTKASLAFKKECQAGGPYAIVYLTDGGMYQEWLKAFTPQQIVKTLQLVGRAHGLRMIFIGAEWDKQMTGERLAQYGDAEWVDLVGETTYDQMVGALLGASLVFGYPAGNTILGAVFGVPTVLLWHPYFHVNFWTNTCPPDAPYVALNVVGLTPRACADAVDEILHKTGMCQKVSVHA